MRQRGRLLGIAVRPAPKASMVELDAARISLDRGVANDTRGRPGRRQVTVLTRTDWDTACARAGARGLAWTARRANLFVDGVDLKGKVGYDLAVGDALLTITGETRPCKRMDGAHVGLMAALEPDWCGGVTCRVVRTGDATIGAEVVLSRRLVRQAVLRLRERMRGMYKGARRIASDFKRGILQGGAA
jgi:MOSC domain-containing protein YiiM